MWKVIYILITQLLALYLGLHLIDLPDSADEVTMRTDIERRDSRIQGIVRLKEVREEVTEAPVFWQFRQSETKKEKDEKIKKKISNLVQQTLHDTGRKIDSVSSLKADNRENPPYKVGFLLSMIKKSRDVLNELFNIAVKHRDHWKALEQLKIFELIVHTNVDTTNLVRQLVEIHIQYMNSSNNNNSSNPKVRKVFLL